MYPQINEFDLENRVTLHLHSLRPEFRNLRVEAQGGAVRLSGRVTSFYLRQLAFAATRRVAGVQRVSDAIEVPEAPTPRACVALA